MGHEKTEGRCGTVAVYVKDRAAREFIEGYFAARPGGAVAFAGSVREFRGMLLDGVAAVVTESPGCLMRIAPRLSGVPVVAMIPGTASAGIAECVRQRAEHYVLPPYQEEDLECKLSLATARRRALRALSQRIEDLEAVADITQLISSSLDPQRVLYMIVKKLSEFLPVTRCSILSISPGDDMHARVVSSFEAPEIGPMDLDLRKYPEIREALRTRRPVIVADAEHDPIMTPVMSIIRPLGIKSIAVLPVTFRSEVIGTLFLRTSITEHRFTEREIRLCEAVAASAANALNNAYLYQEVRSQREALEELAITDFLTGIYNIRYLYHRMEGEFSRAMRYGEPLGCLLMDLDHFKRINDTYGHRAGDLVLREFAQLVDGMTRKSDVFARYGGEEFIMLLPQTAHKGAMAKAGRLVAAVRNHVFKGLARDDMLTISVGVACFPKDRAATHDDLIGYADTALLVAKRGGRNRAESYKA